MHGQMICALHQAVGTIEACPGAGCAFWEEGGAVVEPACAFERLGLEFETRPGMASWLLAIRHDLEKTRDEQNVAAARRLLNEFLPPGLRD